MVNEYNQLLCPIPHCGEPLTIIWECFVDAYGPGGFMDKGEDDYSPQNHEMKWWKVQCLENEHVVMTARDEFPGCWEAHEAGWVEYSDEEGWEFDIDRLRGLVENG